MMLNAIEFMNGLFSLIFVSISILIGIRIAQKYWKNKERIYMLVGISWMGMATPWFPSSFSFLAFLITGKGLILELKLFIAVFFLPFTILLWLTAFTDLLYKKKQKTILIIFTIIGAVFDSFLLYFLFTEPSFIGKDVGPIDEDYGLFVNFYLTALLIVVIITGTLFARASLKLNTAEMKLRGKLLFIAFYSFVIGAILDMLSPLSVIILILARLILISSAIEFYGGFVLPEWLKNILIKK